jgi:putative DNA-invertase from lambdoid prophage Rac
MNTTPDNKNGDHMTKTIFYARVSTTEQNIDHQVTQARAMGFAIDHVLADHGVSGISTRLQDRPDGKRLYDMLRTGDTLVVRWIDRLGRNYTDVTEAIRHFMNQGIIIKTVINAMVFDGATTDPMKMALRDAMISFMAALGQAQAEATKIAQQAGIQAAKAKPHKYLGRKPTYDLHQLNMAQEMIQEGKGPSQIAKELGINRLTILRIKKDPAHAEMALHRWQHDPQAIRQT